MWNYIYKRITGAVAVLFVVSVITFLVLKIIPGDAAQFMLGTEATPESLATLRAAMGLDQPWYIQYFTWLRDFLHFDLGTSYLYGEEVSTLVMQRLPVTLSLSVFSMLIVGVVSLLLGVFSAIKKGSALDYFSRSVMQLGAALPSFWVGMLFIVYFGLRLKWFPVSGFVDISAGFVPHIKSITLPGLVLAIGEVGLLLRTVRTSMLSALREDYMDMARAKGLPQGRINFKYALRSALVAPINVFGMQFAKLVGGTVVVESVFSLPGIGRLVLVAVQQRDIILLQGLVMFITTFVIIISLAVDISVMFINPRIMVEVQGE